MNTYKQIKSNNICDFCNDEKSNHQYNGCSTCSPILNFCDDCFNDEYDYIEKIITEKSNCKCIEPNTDYLDRNQHLFKEVDNSKEITKHLCILCKEIKNTILVYDTFIPCSGNISTYFCHACLENKRSELNEVVEKNSFCFQC